MIVMEVTNWTLIKLEAHSTEENSSLICKLSQNHMTEEDLGPKGNLLLLCSLTDMLKTTL